MIIHSAMLTSLHITHTYAFFACSIHGFAQPLVEQLKFMNICSRCKRKESRLFSSVEMRP